MTEQLVAPDSIKLFFHTIVQDWLPEHWRANLKFVNDEFKEGWFADIYWIGFEKNPQIPDFPCNGDTPIETVTRLLNVFQRGINEGKQQASDAMVVKAMADAAEQTMKAIHSGVGSITVSKHLQDMTSLIRVRRAAEMHRDWLTEQANNL